MTSLQQPIAPCYSVRCFRAAFTNSWTRITSMRARRALYSILALATVSCLLRFAISDRLTMHWCDACLGKLVMQAFLQFPNLTHCVGVELAISRSARGMRAARSLAQQVMALAAAPGGATTLAKRSLFYARLSSLRLLLPASGWRIGTNSLLMTPLRTRARALSCCLLTTSVLASPFACLFSDFPSLLMCSRSDSLPLFRICVLSAIPSWYLCSSSSSVCRSP